VAEDWTGAIAALKLAAVRDPYNADIQNYIGYGYRRLRQLGPAMQHYQQALVEEDADELPQRQP
jgi:Flp pilus assembly protein TadD